MEEESIYPKEKFAHRIIPSEAGKHNENNTTERLSKEYEKKGAVFQCKSQGKIYSCALILSSLINC